MAEFPNRQPLTLFAATGLLGLTLNQLWPQSGPVWMVALLVAIILWGVAGRLRSRVFQVPLLFLGVLFLFAARHADDERRYQSATLDDVLGVEEEPTVMVAVIDQPVRLQRDALENTVSRSVVDAIDDSRTKYQTRLVVEVESLRRGLAPVRFTGRCLVMVDAELAALRPGDRVRLYGRIEAIPPPTNPGETDARVAARRQGIHARMRVDSAEQVESLENGPLSLKRRLQRWIADRAATARETVLKRIDPAHHGLALALTLGQRDLLDRATNERLLVTGTAHLLSVSGMHLGIIVVLTSVLTGLLRLPSGGRVGLLLAVMIFYVAITGARPPVLRAAILLSTVVMATQLARPNQPLNSLSLAALLLAFWSPAEVFGIGVQLSFLAVATLLVCGRPLSKSRTSAAETIRLEDRFDALAGQAHPAWRRYTTFVGLMIGNAFWYSAAVTVMALPLVWSQFHVVSPVSVFVNVLLTPLMGLALSAGVMTIVAGWCLPPLASLSGQVCGAVLSGMQWLIDQAAALPGGHFWLPSPPAFWVIAFYLGVVVLWLVRPSLPRRVRRVGWLDGGLLSMWLVVALMLATWPSALPDGTAEATFLDVGHGTATILRPSHDEVWLYDCGWMGNANASSRYIEDALWQLGVTHVEGIFLSHADADHFNALPGLAERFSIGVVVVPPGFLNGGGRVLDECRQTIERHSIAVLELHRGVRLSRSGFGSDWLDGMTVLHPPEIPLDAGDNANSMVLQWQHHGRVLLLPGDLEPPGTGVLINTPRPPPGGVMMAPHHGSLYMDADAVLQWARPRETVVSGGRRASQPEVTEMLSAAGGGVHVTSSVGAIRVRLDAQGLVQIQAFLQQPW